MTFGLLLNAIIAGILGGGFYAAVTVEITIAFGILDVVNIAYPVFVILGSFIAYIVNRTLGVDQILAVVALSPLFFLFGAAIHRLYCAAFESRGKRSHCQLELDLPMPGRGEAPRRNGREVEAVMARSEPESPTSPEHLMEAICDPDNVKAALEAVVRNKGAPGIDGVHGRLHRNAHASAHF